MFTLSESDSKEHDKIEISDNLFKIIKSLEKQYYDFTNTINYNKFSTVSTLFDGTLRPMHTFEILCESFKKDTANPSKFNLQTITESALFRCEEFNNTYIDDALFRKTIFNFNNMKELLGSSDEFMHYLQSQTKSVNEMGHSFKSNSRQKLSSSKTALISNGSNSQMFLKMLLEEISYPIKFTLFNMIRQYWGDISNMCSPSRTAISRNIPTIYEVIQCLNNVHVCHSKKKSLNLNPCQKLQCSDLNLKKFNFMDDGYLTALNPHGIKRQRKRKAILKALKHQPETKIKAFDFYTFTNLLIRNSISIHEYPACTCVNSVCTHVNSTCTRGNSGDIVESPVDNLKSTTDCLEEPTHFFRNLTRNTCNTLGNLGGSVGNFGDSFGNLGDSLGNLSDSLGNLGDSFGNSVDTFENEGNTFENQDNTFENRNDTFENSVVYIENLPDLLGNSTDPLGKPSDFVENPDDLENSADLGNPDCIHRNPSETPKIPSDALHNSFGFIGHPAHHLRNLAVDLGHPADYLGNSVHHFGNQAHQFGNQAHHFGNQAHHFEKPAHHLGNPAHHLGKPAHHLGNLAISSVNQANTIRNTTNLIENTTDMTQKAISITLAHDNDTLSNPLNTTRISTSHCDMFKSSDDMFKNKLMKAKESTTLDNKFEYSPHNMCTDTSEIGEKSKKVDTVLKIHDDSVETIPKTFLCSSNEENIIYEKNTHSFKSVKISNVPQSNFMVKTYHEHGIASPEISKLVKIKEYTSNKCNVLEIFRSNFEGSEHLYHSLNMNMSKLRFTTNSLHLKSITESVSLNARNAAMSSTETQTTSLSVSNTHGKEKYFSRQQNITFNGCEMNIVNTDNLKITESDLSEETVRFASIEQENHALNTCLDLDEFTNAYYDDRQKTTASQTDISVRPLQLDKSHIYSQEESNFFEESIVDTSSFDTIQRCKQHQIFQWPSIYSGNSSNDGARVNRLHETKENIKSSNMKGNINEHQFHDKSYDEVNSSDHVAPCVTMMKIEKLDDDSFYKDEEHTVKKKKGSVVRMGLSRKQKVKPLHPYRRN